MPQPPLYMRILTEYRARILSGEYQIGDQLPSEMQISVQYGVSNITARRVLNELAREGLIYRRRGEGSFVASSVPRGADAGIRVVALILPYRDEYIKSADIIRALSVRLQEKGFYVSVHFSYDDVAAEREILERVVRDGVKGVVLFSVSSQSNVDLLMRLHARRFPLVLLDRGCGIEGIPTVESDNLTGGRLATEALLARGHTRIAFVTNHDLLFATAIRDRYRGYIEALQDAGLENCEAGIVRLDRRAVDALLRGEPDGNLAERAEVEALLRCLRPPMDCTALFCVSDPVALAVMNLLCALSIDVPGEVSVVGFDNLPLTRQLRVPLTTIHQDLAAFGERAAEAVLRAMAGERASVPPVPVKLVSRDSVAKPRPERPSA